MTPPAAAPCMTETLRAQIVELRAALRLRNAAETGCPQAATSGGCHVVCPEVAAMLGGRHVSGWYDARHLGDPVCVDHHWVELDGGVIVDPTADSLSQDGDGIAVIDPDELRHRRYRPYHALVDEHGAEIDCDEPVSALVFDTTQPYAA